MHIGLEYEGLMVDRYNNPVRWHELPFAMQTAIRFAARTGYGHKDPVDTYDCLAEVRTPPIENPYPILLYNSLMKEVFKLSGVFSLFDYRIIWDEREIQPMLHHKIQETIKDKLTDKTTWVITPKGVERYTSTDNYHRGGGLHINVSDVDPKYSTALVLKLHSELPKFGFKSNYRNNILYRQYDTLTEYMSFGFPLDKNPLKWGYNDFWGQIIKICKEFT